MRALPIFFALLAAATPAYGQKGDISVETDIGEQYIIKMSAVYVDAQITRKRLIELHYAPRLNVLNEGADRIRQNMRQTDADHKNCIAGGFGKKHCGYNRNSTKYVETERQRLEYVEGNIAKVKEEMDEKIRSPPQAIEAVLVKYRPIFVDLNNEKKGLGYSKIMCVNPLLPSAMFKVLRKEYPKYRLAAPSEIALEAAEQKLCKRVAGFR